MQILAWAIEVAATQQSNDFSSRTILLAVIFQFFIIGASLVITSNIFAKRASQEYCKEYLGKTYATSSNPARYRIFAIQFLYQFISLLLCIFTRFLLGNMFNDTSANSIMGVLLFIYVGVWSVLSIRQSFSIPILVNENVSGKELKLRSKTLNKSSFSTLLGTYSYCWLLVLVLSGSMVGSLQYIISKDVIKSIIGQLAILNTIFAFIVSFACVIFSFILVTTYFNGRVAHEGFDLAVTIDEIEQEGRSRGKLLNVNAR